MSLISGITRVCGPSLFQAVPYSATIYLAGRLVNKLQNRAVFDAKLLAICAAISILAYNFLFNLSSRLMDNVHTKLKNMQPSFKKLILREGAVLFVNLVPRPISTTAAVIAYLKFASIPEEQTRLYKNIVLLSLLVAGITAKIALHREEQRNQQVKASKK